MSDGPARDDVDELVLDESFVRGGRRELSADERVERLRRIAAENASSDGWRSGPALVIAATPRRQRHQLRTTLLVLSIALGLLFAASWAQSEGFLGGTGFLSSTAPGQADPPPAGALSAGGETPTSMAPAGPLERLAPLPPDPGGEGGYRFMSTLDDGTDRPVTYDPCRAITYVVRRAGEPAGADAMLEAAVAELAAATGLVFQRGADTDEAPRDRRKAVQPDRYGPGYAPVLIAWSDERESPDLAGYIAGFAGSDWDGWDEGSLRYVTGTVILDREDAQQLSSSPGGGAAVRSLILHELGHLVGLDHVADRDQIMFSEGGDNRLELGPGDRRGLRLLGAGTCHADWDRLAEAS